MAMKNNQTTISSPTRGKKVQTVIEVSGPDPVLLLAANGKRLEAFFYNAGAGNVYIGPHDVDGVALSAVNGIPIVTTGNFSDSASYDAWWAIPAGGALYNVIVLEVEE